MPASARRAKGKARASAAEIISPGIPLGKQLAHTDKKVRDRAVASLVAFLSRSGNEEGGSVMLPESEMKKLWKGLFYCFWMSDKPLIQQALAADLAELILLIDPSHSQNTVSDSKKKEEERFEVAISYLAEFWRTIVREWDGIDRLRIDKFYLLIRRFVHATFRLLARSGWIHENIKAVNEILTGSGAPLSYSGPKVPISLAMHLSDIYLEELDKVLGLPEVNSQPPCPVLEIVSPLISLLLHTPTQSLHTRLTTSLITPLLNALNLASSTIDPKDQPSAEIREDAPVYAHILMGCTLSREGVATPDELRKGFLRDLFKQAGQEGVIESNRRKIYKLYREEMALGDDED